MIYISSFRQVCVFVVLIVPHKKYVAAGMKWKDIFSAL